MNGKAMYAGVLIGIGNIINLSVGNKYVGALLFSFALMTIMQCDLPLYTGRIGYYDEYKITEFWEILCWNCCGVLLSTVMGVIAIPSLWDKFISPERFADLPYVYLFRGILCGICMYVAVSSNKSLIVIMAIMIFILAGFRHCIAEFPFVILNASRESFVAFVLIVAGNSIGSIMARILHKEM